MDPSCFAVGWNAIEAVPAAEGAGAPNGEVAGAAPKAGVGAAVKFDEDDVRFVIHVVFTIMLNITSCAHHQRPVLGIQRQELL